MIFFEVPLTLMMPDFSISYRIQPTQRWNNPIISHGYGMVTTSQKDGSTLYWHDAWWNMIRISEKQSPIHIKSLYAFIFFWFFSFFFTLVATWGWSLPSLLQKNWVNQGVKFIVHSACAGSLWTPRKLGYDSTRMRREWSNRARSKGWLHKWWTAKKADRREEICWSFNR